MPPEIFNQVVLAINLVTISIKIPLSSYIYLNEHIEGVLLPIKIDDLDEKKLEKIKYFFKQSLTEETGFVGQLIPVFLDIQDDVEKIAEQLHRIGIHAMIILNYRPTRLFAIPVFGMMQYDFVFLKRIIESDRQAALSETSVLQNEIGLDDLGSGVIMNHHPNGKIPFVIQLFLQLPPIITILIIVMLWKAIIGDDQYPPNNYIYEDVPIAMYYEMEDDVCTMCCICYEEFTVTDKVRILECKHHYHVGCITTWLARSNICPMCRKDVYRREYADYNGITYI